MKETYSKVRLADGAIVYLDKPEWVGVTQTAHRHFRCETNRDRSLGANSHLGYLGFELSWDCEATWSSNKSDLRDKDFADAIRLVLPDFVLPFSLKDCPTFFDREGYYLTIRLVTKSRSRLDSDNLLLTILGFDSPEEFVSHVSDLKL